MIDWEVMKNWPPILWVIFIGMIGLIGFTISYIFQMYAIIHIAFYYEVLLVAIIVGVIGYAYLISDKYEFHFHHYCIGMFGMIFACYQNIFITAVHAIFNGIMIEGACRWGYDPIFYPKSPEP